MRGNNYSSTTHYSCVYVQCEGLAHTCTGTGLSPQGAQQRGVAAGAGAELPFREKTKSTTSRVPPGGGL